MKILEMFRNSKKSSANIAKDRLLQLIVKSNTLDLDKLQKELLEVISRYIPIHENNVTVEVEHHPSRSVVELSVILPGQEQ